MKLLKWLMLSPMLAWGQTYTTLYNQTTYPPNLIYYVQNYGARCDGVTDDAAAWNAAIAALATAADVAGTMLSAQLKGCGTGQSMVKSTIKATQFSGSPVASGVTFDFSGTCILGQTNGTPVIDAMGSKYIRWIHTCIKGMPSQSPNVGIQIGRISGGAPADQFYFDHPVIEGFFTFAAFYNNGSETTQFVMPRFNNATTSGTTYAMVQDGYNFFVNAGTITSTNVTLASGINVWSFIQDQVLGGTITNNNTTNPSAAMWLGNTHQHRFSGPYINSSSSNAITLYQNSAGGNNRSLTIDAHLELNTVLRTFLLTGDGALTSVSLGNLHYYDNQNFATNSVFAIDGGSAITAVTLYFPDIKIDLFNHGSGVALFDVPANYTVNGGDVWLPATGNWSGAPASQYGLRVCDPACTETFTWQGNLNNGTNNISTGRVTVLGSSLPSVGIYQASANELDFSTATTRRGFFDSSGNFTGLGTITATTNYVHGVFIVCQSAGTTVSGTPLVTHTGDTNEFNLVNCQIPAGTWTTGASLRITALWLRTAVTTNSITYTIRVGTQAAVSGGDVPLLSSNTTSGNVSVQTEAFVRSVDSTHQIYIQIAAGAATGVSNSAPAVGTLNTANAQYVNFNCTDTTSSADTCGIYAYIVELITP